MLAKSVWRTQAEYEGWLRVLQWGGIGNTKVEWPRQYAVLHCGQLYLMDKKASLSPVNTENLYRDRYLSSNGYVCFVHQIMGRLQDLDRFW